MRAELRGRSYSSPFWGLAMPEKNPEKPPLTVDADAFDSVLKRMIEHKPVPKKTVKASRKTKRGKILK